MLGATHQNSQKSVRDKDRSLKYQMTTESHYEVIFGPELKAGCMGYFGYAF
jgi:hypothetical protein